MQLTSPCDLLVPRNLTALMQHLQMLVGPCQHRYWCGGEISALKLPAFLEKMSVRYPSVLRNARQRSYDRTRDRASVRLIVYPIMSASMSRTADISVVTPVSKFAWWLVSNDGHSGLADSNSPDAHVATDAMASATHITLGDYVLAYVSKPSPRTVLDKRTSQSRTVWKATSTWTWKPQPHVAAEVRAAIDDCAKSLRLGEEPGPDVAGRGLRGVLAAQRSRPQFSGVRNDVIALHRYARDVWAPHEQRWLKSQPWIGPGEVRSATLRPISEVMAHHLPKMRRIRLYDSPPRRVRDWMPDQVGRLPPAPVPSACCSKPDASTPDSAPHGPSRVHSRDRSTSGPV